MERHYVGKSAAKHRALRIDVQTFRARSVAALKTTVATRFSAAGEPPPFLPRGEKSGLGEGVAWGKKLGRGLVLALVCALAGAAVVAKEKPPVQYQIPLPAPPNFSDLDWLAGDWTGKTLNGNPADELRLSIAFDLEKRILVLRGNVSLAATQTVPLTKETWMGILNGSPRGTGLALRMFSSTGFITLYRVTVDGPQVWINPEGGEQPPTGWLFRRCWVRIDPNDFTETVQAAPPGK